MSSLPESLVRFRSELEDAIRRELEAEATARSNAWGARLLRAVRRRPGRTTLALAAVAGAAAAALFVSSPWQTSPGRLPSAVFLERAQAALYPPEGTIWHYKLQVTYTSVEYGCTVEQHPGELWADQSSPWRWRVVFTDYFGDDFPARWLSAKLTAAELRGIACAVPRTKELGGYPAEDETLTFVPPNTLRAIPAPFGGQPAGHNMVEYLRDRFARGAASYDGTMELDGQVVERIRLEPHGVCRGDACQPSYVYVDPGTFYPVRAAFPYGYTLGLAGGLLHFHVVMRFPTYEYLPRTEANIALTDIRAQHPNATVVKDKEDR